MYINLLHWKKIINKHINTLLISEDDKQDNLENV